jgi:predicted cobalt transporter CbtA
MLYFVGVSHDESAALGLLMFSTLLIWAIVGAIVGFFMRSNKKRR